MATDEQFIRAWRESAIDPATADADELSIRRQLSNEEFHRQELPPQERFASEVGATMAWDRALLRREMNKAVHGLRGEIEGLESRIAQLESRGGGQKSRRPRGR